MDINIVFGFHLIHLKGDICNYKFSIYNMLEIMTFATIKMKKLNVLNIFFKQKKFFQGFSTKNV